MEIKKNLIALGTTAILSLTGCGDQSQAPLTPTQNLPPTLSSLPEPYNNFCNLITAERSEEEAIMLPTFQEARSDCIVAEMPTVPNRIVLPSNTKWLTVCLFSSNGGTLCSNGEPKIETLTENGYDLYFPYNIYLVVYSNNNVVEDDVYRLAEIYDTEAFTAYAEPYLNNSNQPRTKQYISLDKISALES